MPPKRILQDDEDFEQDPDFGEMNRPVFPQEFMQMRGPPQQPQARGVRPQVLNPEGVRPAPILNRADEQRMRELQRQYNLMADQAEQAQHQQRRQAAMRHAQARPPPVRVGRPLGNIAPGMAMGRAPIPRVDPATGLRPGAPNSGRAHYANGRVIYATTWVFATYGAAHVVNDNAHLIGQPVPGTTAVLDYMCGQVEQGQAPGPRNNNNGLHFQGYLEFSGDVNAYDIMQFFGWRPGETHLEPRFGTQDQAIDYTKKLETALWDAEKEPTTAREQAQAAAFRWTQAGQRHAANAAGGWAELQRVVQNGGAGIVDLVNGNVAHFKILAAHFNGVKSLINIMDKHRDADVIRDVKVIVYYGDPRCGKTGTVFRRHKPSEIYTRSTAAAMHFTGYEGEPVLLLNEFGQPNCTIAPDDAQTILEGYPIMSNAKYGSVRARWTTVYICTNIHPNAWFPKADPVVRQSIIERVHEIWHVTKQVVTLEFGPGSYPPIPDPTKPAPRIVKPYLEHVAQDAAPVPAPAPAPAPAPVPAPTRGMTLADKLAELYNKYPNKDMTELLDDPEFKNLRVV